jgi:hypothetical protein
MRHRTPHLCGCLDPGRPVPPQRHREPRDPGLIACGTASFGSSNSTSSAYVCSTRNWEVVRVAERWHSVSAAAARSNLANETHRRADSIIFGAADDPVELALVSSLIIIRGRSQFPPTILTGGTRDLLLNNTVRCIASCVRPAWKPFYEGQSLAHYLGDDSAPETKEVFAEISSLFNKPLGK